MQHFNRKLVLLQLFVSVGDSLVYLVAEVSYSDTFIGGYRGSSWNGMAFIGV